MFYSLTQNRYQGFAVGPDSYTQGIIRERKLKEFEGFLNKYNLNLSKKESQEIIIQVKEGRKKKGPQGYRADP